MKYIFYYRMRFVVVFVAIQIFIFDATAQRLYNVKENASKDSTYQELISRKKRLSNDLEENLSEYCKIILRICDWHMSKNDLSSAIIELRDFYSTPHFIKLPVEDFIEFNCKEGEIREWLFDYEGALRCYKQAYRIIEQANITESKQAIKVLVRLCYLSLRQENDDELEYAYWCYKKAYNIWISKYSNDKDIGYDILLLSTNFINPEENGVERAKALYIYCLEQTDGQEGWARIRQEAARSLSNVYEHEGDIEGACFILEQIKNESYNKLTIIEDLIILYLRLGNYSKANEYQKIAHSYMRKRAIDIICHFNELERPKLLYEFSNEFVFYGNNVAVSMKDGNAVTMAYDDLLFSKNIQLNTNKSIRNHICQSGNSTLISQIDKYYSLREQYAYKVLDLNERISIARQMVHLDSLIVNSIHNLPEILNKQGGTFEDVESTILSDEVAIEFCSTPIFKNNELIGNYIAYVVRKGQTSPLVVILDDDSIIDDLITLGNDGIDTLPEETANLLYNSKNSNELYKLLWSKLEPYIDGCKTIYYSPSCELWSLNFDLLKDDSGNLLGNKYNLIRVSSTGMIPTIKTNTYNFNNAVLYGDITYDTNLSEMQVRGQQYNSFSGTKIDSMILSRSYQERGKWNNLPYTKLEIDSINTILEKTNVRTSKFTGSQANEESFKGLDGKSPDIIHLATHGFVIDTKEKASNKKIMENTFVYNSTEDFQLWCGLMLSGSNNAWTGRFNLEKVEDGILTADEISRIDLSNTKLVVLSACETALGKVDRFEGVLGLQRAFKKAGAQTIVMSLWKVPDESTSILMTQFYKNLMTGIERHQALKDAMNYVKTLFPDPYYWAGFIMLD